MDEMQKKYVPGSEGFITDIDYLTNTHYAATNGLGYSPAVEVGTPSGITHTTAISGVILPGGLQDILELIGALHIQQYDGDGTTE